MISRFKKWRQQRQLQRELQQIEERGIHCVAPSFILIEADVELLRRRERILRRHLLGSLTGVVSLDLAKWWLETNEKPFPIIIANAQLPGTEPFAVHGLLERDPRWAQVPCVYLAANSMELRERAHDLGIEDHVFELPVNVRELRTHTSQIFMKNYRP